MKPDNSTARQSGRLIRPCTLVWLILMVLTLLMLVAAQLGSSGGGFVVLLLLATLIKTQLVSDYFMGLAQADWFWRLIMIIYLLVIITMIGVAYWLGSR